MASGLKFHNPEGQSTLYFTELHDHFSVYFRGQNTESLVLNQPLLHEPGKVFQYRNTNPLALMSLIKRTNREYGRNPLTWPREALFDRIGVRSFTLETDAFGNFVLSGYEYATARDWARLGLFALRDGNWQGERLWPQSWRTVLTTPSPADSIYGGLVWLKHSRELFKDFPADAFAFEGWGNQITLILPAQDVVIVRLGLSDSASFQPYFADIVRRVLDALTPESPRRSADTTD